MNRLFTFVAAAFWGDSMKNVMKGAALFFGAATISATPVAASAATVMFSLTSQGFSTVGSGSSTIRFTTATVGGVQVRISAWSLSGTSGSGAVGKSAIQQYSTGLGAVTSPNDSTGDNTHTIDNKHTRDFLLFQFDQSVRLIDAKLTAYKLPGASLSDTDFTVGRGTIASPWTTQLNLTGTTSAGLAALLTGGMQNYNGPSGTSTQTLSALGAYGNLWIVGTSFANSGTFDAFKFSQLRVATAPPVPEASTWMMMIVGFGAVGATVRRTRRMERTATA